jgi:hypothetical protein
MTFFVYLDSGFSSDAETKEEAIDEATTNLIERLQKDIVARRRKELYLDALEWLVEEEE